MQERGLCSTLNGGCHPGGHNTRRGKVFTPLDKVGLACHRRNGNFGEVCKVDHFALTDGATTFDTVAPAQATFTTADTCWV